MPSLGSPRAAGPSASAREAVGLGQHCWCAGAGDHPCWPPADGSRRGGVNSWAPMSPLRFQGHWKALGAGRALAALDSRTRRRQAQFPVACGKALSALGGGQTGAAYLGTTAWPVGTLRLCGPGRQRARGRVSGGTCGEKGGQASASESWAHRGGRCPPGRKGHLSGASSTSGGADSGEPGPIPGGGSPDGSLRPPAGRRWESTGSMAVSPGWERAGQEGGRCWAQ